ncbi:bifunctional UDP-N-acetylglucosamine diphosphorylase/glucosamine-1-phosphate N-acetyltransferase GlmU [soil metagenome]
MSAPTAADAFTALIMAAGQGTRMKSETPKVLHEVCGRPMVAWPVIAAREAGAGRVCVIASPGKDLTAALPDGTETVLQPNPDGTGGAIRAAREVVDASESVLILSGDTPLLRGSDLAGLIEAHERTGAAATVMTTELDDPASFGRVVRGAGDEVEKIVEAKAEGDATPTELEITEVNVGIYVFTGPALAAALDQLSNDNSQGEYYLPDALPAIREAGGTVVAHKVGDPAVNLGVNDRSDLARVSHEARRRILLEHMHSGVTIEDPDSTWIDADVELAPYVTLLPGTSLRGATAVGSGSVVGPMTTLIDSRLGEGVKVPHSYLVECSVGDGASVGPFAYLRPAAALGEGSKAGAFVEIKNSEIGEGAKVPHLSYVGDADVGAGANLGAGTITANYDGFRKHRTVVGEGVRTGVDTALVAPVEVGDGAYTGAGSVITEDVPEGALGIARAKQSNVEGYADEAEQSKNEKGSSES